MKKIFTKIVWGFVAMFTLIAGESHAATITATVSGNWSSPSTWSGGVAGATVNLDNIVIPAGITVTLDMDVQVTGILGSISVSGDLNSSNSHSLMINSGTLSGNGDMNLYYLELGSVGGMSFTGDLTVNHFITSNLSLNLASQVTLVDTLYLKAGSLTLGSGSLLMLNTGSNIKVEDGALAISGGVFTGTNSYDVMYVGSSKTTGIELSGTGFNHLHIRLSNASQSLSLGSNTTVNNVLNHTMGTLNLNGRTLIIAGNYVTSNGSMISGSTTSSLHVLTSFPTTSNFVFNAGARTLNTFIISVLSSGNVILGSDLTINGHLSLNKGALDVINSSVLTMNTGSQITVNLGSILLTGGSNFDGTASYDVNYINYSKVADIELSGSGLNNVNLNMSAATDSVKMKANTIINGTLSLDKGSFNLNGYKLELKGNLSSTASGWFQGNSNSELFINTTAGLSDTISFSPGRNYLNNFSVKTGNGSNAMLNYNLMVENLIFVDGGLTIYNNNLTINASGMISGYDMNKHVVVKGTGKLLMNVNTASPYVTFPVGTVTSYAPVHIQRTGGTSAMLGVNTHDGVWSMGTTGSDFATSLSVVDRTWDISSASTPSINVNAKFEWATAMEVNGFNRNMAYVSQYSGNWDMVAPSASTVTGSGIYQLARNGITSPGQFAVVDNLSALSVKEQEEVTFSLYPNPTHNHLTVVLKDNEGFAVEVFDALGNKAIAEKSIKGSSTDVDFSSLSAGVYFVKISNDNTQSIRRVVKQ